MLFTNGPHAAVALRWCYRDHLFLRRVLVASANGSAGGIGKAAQPGGGPGGGMARGLGVLAVRLRLLQGQPGFDGAAASLQVSAAIGRYAVHCSYDLVHSVSPVSIAVARRLTGERTLGTGAQPAKPYSRSSSSRKNSVAPSS